MKKLFVLFLLAVLALPQSNAQFRRMGKKCVPSLKPYTFNGQLNQVVLTEGESAELVMVFRGGKKYRVQTCYGKSFGKLQIKLLDRNKKVLFDNADHNYTKYWDFEVESTQQISIEVYVPESDKGFSDISGRGCVALLVGFMDSENTNAQSVNLEVD